MGACWEFNGSSLRVIGGLLGVCRKLTEGNREFTGNTPRVHQKMTETHPEFIRGYRKDYRELGRSLDTLDKLIIFVCFSIDWRVGLLQCSHSLKGARQVRGQGRVVKKGEEATTSPEGLNYPKSKVSIRKEVDSKERHSAAEADLSIVKGPRYKATDSRVVGLAAPCMANQSSTTQQQQRRAAGSQEVCCSQSRRLKIKQKARRCSVYSGFDEDVEGISAGE
ncbi:hypothetical protein BHE74_00045393 [Ensete ventricosum]|nr:hypothetical protein BHE74_00045393 [Ensete ventricosum]